MTFHARITGIGEPSFAEVIKAIAVATDLNENEKRFWPTALRQLGSYLGQPIETIPGRIGAIAGRVAKLHPERLGVNAKTFANHRANAKAALRWFCRQQYGTARNAPMGEDYRALWQRVGDQHARDMLSPFFRFLSALGVQLADVDDTYMDAYGRHRNENNFRPFRRHQLRQLVRYWNRCRENIEDWPRNRLTEPKVISGSVPRFDEFPSQLREDLQNRHVYLAKPHLTRDGRLRKACSPTTIEFERRSLEAAIRKAVSIGIRLDEFKSLHDLVHPDRVAAIIDAYWKENGDIPAIATIDLAIRFRNIARLEGLPPADLERLEQICRLLEEYRPKGLTRKNRDIVRSVLNSGLWAKVVALPEALMAEADAVRKTSPVTSGVSAQIAIAIRILLVAPIRIANLSQITIGTHLIRPGGPGTNYFLVFERYDVKNDQTIEFELDELTTELIDRYIHNHRSNLMRGANHDQLFPGGAQSAKASDTFGLQITAKLERRLGIHLTPHQFRHCAAALLLEHYPGNYELVRQVLGHKNVQTTMSFYVGLETIAATRAFTAIVTGLDAVRPSPALSVRVRKTKRHD